MKIGIIERYIVDPLPIEVFKEHVRQIWTLFSNGVVRESYKFEDNSGSIFIMETSSVEEAKFIVIRLPLYLVG